MAKQPKIDLTVKVSPSVLDALDALANASNGEFTRSDIIRQALDHFLINHKVDPNATTTS